MSLVSGLLLLPSTSANAAPASADLTVSGSVSPDPASGGETLTYVFSVHNAGPDPAAGTTLIVELPSGLSPDSTSSSAGCVAAASTVTCDLGTVDPGPADVRVKIVVVAPDVDADTFVDTHATVAASTPDPDDTNNELTVPSLVLARPSDQVDLELTSVINVPDPVTGGYDLGSWATATNLGPGDATGVTLTDTLAPGESFVAAGSDPSCTERAGMVTCVLGGMASGDVVTVLIITKTPQVAADITLHDSFSVVAPEDGTHGNDVLDVATEVRAPRADFVAGYVPASQSTTWLTDATQLSRGNPVATIADPTVASVGIPGGGPGGPVTVTERPCGQPFACMTLRRATGGFHPASEGVAGSLIQVSVPSGYDASNPIMGVFWDDWSVLGSGWGTFKVSYQDGTADTPSVLPSCGGWKHTAPPCVAAIGRSFAWWDRWAFADLRTLVRFTNDGTFGGGREAAPERKARSV